MMKKETTQLDLVAKHQPKEVLAEVVLMVVLYIQAVMAVLCIQVVMVALCIQHK
jgi:hypothetical protein